MGNGLAVDLRTVGSDQVGSVGTVWLRLPGNVEAANSDRLFYLLGDTLREWRRTERAMCSSLALWRTIGGVASTAYESLLPVLGGGLLRRAPRVSQISVRRAELA